MDNLILRDDIIDDDLEIFEIINHGIPRQVFLRPDLFHSHDDRAFFSRFRLTKETVLQLLPSIEPYIERPYNRNNTVTPMNQLLITLMYFASNSHMVTISDVGKMNKSTVCRIIKRVSNAIARLYRDYIIFPRNELEVNQTKNKFFDIASFPNVIGAVDGTHIRILSPGGDDAEIFRNRKNYFSINVQVISNAYLEITDLVARWPGSVHDVTIFNNSIIRRQFENGQHPDCFLLGDSAYAMKDYLLTPLQNPRTEPEQLYNESHIRTRGAVEKLFGIWKRRFPILAYGCRLKLDNILTIIVATAVLYNIAKKMGEAEPPLPAEVDEHEFQVLLRNGDIPVVPILNPNQLLGPQVRQNLIINYFANLQ
ncbi:putative nuclease HARBI1 [Anoplophora glabripennis]|uniref:putative nuclease HARBI1 n=1 Tax=Anoplophora glabripennis TaxID=217634 RepID=UPI0008753971|nr:putative nuclease HARBI1 [Anoplophora glabripennis]